MNKAAGQAMRSSIRRAKVGHARVRSDMVPSEELGIGFILALIYAHGDITIVWLLRSVGLAV